MSFRAMWCVWLFALLSLFSTSFASAPPPARDLGCAVSLQQAASLKPILLNGVLGKTATGEKVFGLAPYMGAGHRGVVSALELAGHKIVEFLWSGEIQLQNGKVLRANETSGMMVKLGLTRQNSVSHLEEYLRENFSGAVTSATSFEPFVYGSPNHLDDRWNHFELSSKNIRHDMGNKFAAPIMALHLLLHDPRDPTYLGILRESFPVIRTFTDYLGPAQLPGFDFDRFLSLNHKILSGPGVTAADVSEALQLTRQYMDGAVAYVESPERVRDAILFLP